MHIMFLVGSILCSLVHLTLCTCETEWLNLLIRVLKYSPNLRALKLADVYTYIFNCLNLIHIYIYI